MDSFIDKFAQRRNAQELIRANAMAEAEEREKLAAQLTEYERAMQELRRCNLQNIENAEKVRELLAASLNKIEEVQRRDVGVEKTERTVEEVKNALQAMSSQVTQLLAGQQNRTAELIAGQQSSIEKLLAEQQNRTAALLTEQQDRTSALLTEQQKRTEVLLKEQYSQTADILERQQGSTASLLVEQRDQIAELLSKQNSKSEEEDTRTAELMEAQRKSIEEMIHASDEFNHKEAVKVYRNVQAVIEGALPKQTEEITEAIKNAEVERSTPVAMMVLWGLTFVAATAGVVIEVLKILGYL